MTVICDARRNNSYPGRFRGACLWYQRESFLFLQEPSQWGSWGEFPRARRAPEPFRQPGETTTGGCTVIKQTDP